MISLDTNVLVRLLVEDNPEQSARARKLVEAAGQADEPVLVLAGVLLETVWVLTAGYGYNRESVAFFFDALLSSPTYHVEHSEAIRRAVEHYARGGDFADLLFAEISASLGAEQFVSFDKKLSSIYPKFVFDPIAVRLRRGVNPFSKYS